MRTMRLCMVLATVVYLTSSAVAWEVIPWGGSGTGWEATAEHGIQINAPGSYKFYATTGGSGGDLAEITNVFCDANISAGTVTLSIVRDPATGGGVGCTYLGQMNLTAATASNVAELRIAGDAGTVGPLSFGQLNDNAPFVADDVLDTLTIGTLSGNLDCNSLCNFTTMTASGLPIIDVAEPYAYTMTINGTWTVGSLTLGGVSGSVSCSPRIGGAVTVDGDVTGTLDLIGVASSANSILITGAIGSGGSVIARKSVGGFVRVNGNIAGTLDVRRDVTGTARELMCGGSVTPTGVIYLASDQAANVYASVNITGDLLGMIEVKDILAADDDATYGHIRVLGAFGDPDNMAKVRLLQGLSTNKPAYVCMNYNGDRNGGHDVWDQNSYVQIVAGANQGTYTAPNDGYRIHGEPPACGLGDANGSGGVDFADIDAFVALLGFNGTTYPGREPAVLYRADINCSGFVTFADIDPFVAQLGVTDPNCAHCTESEGLLGGGNLLASAMGSGNDALGSTGSATNAPQTVASYLAANVSAANYDTLVDAVDYVATFPPVTPVTDWAQVAALLSGE